MRLDGPPDTSRSPKAAPIGAREGMQRIRTFCTAHPDGDYLFGTGESMRPLYGENTVLLLERLPMNRLAPGMTVVYAGASGHRVAHVLVRLTPAGWSVQGINNPEPDEVRVTEGNYIGAVVGAYQLSTSLGCALLQEAPAGRAY